MLVLQVYYYQRAKFVQVSRLLHVPIPVLVTGVRLLHVPIPVLIIRTASQTGRMFPRSV